MSTILASIIEKKTPDWNKRLHKSDDLDQLSQFFRVPIIEDETAKAKGEYLVVDNVPMIILKPGLQRELRLWVALHEFGHHLLHFPVNHKFSKGTRRKMDREANFFAAIALIPTFLIKENLIDEVTIDAALGLIAQEFNFPKELLKIRKEIWEAYQI